MTINTTTNTSRYFDGCEMCEHFPNSRMSNSNLNLARNNTMKNSFKRNDNSKLPLMLSLSLSKCRSSVDMQQQQQQHHQQHLHHINDYRLMPNRPPQQQSLTYDIGVISQSKPLATTAAATIDTYSIGSSANNLLYQCNDVTCFNNNHGSNQRNSTLLHPPSSSSTVSNTYKDSYLCHYTNKLCKLQSFISTPDLTSDSSNSDVNRLQYENLTGQTLNDGKLMRPDVIQMHTFHEKEPIILSDTPPPAPPSLSSAQIYQCHHHHKHNQGMNKTNKASIIKQHTAVIEKNQPAANTTSFFADNCCAGSCKKVTILACSNSNNNSGGNSTGITTVSKTDEKTASKIFQNTTSPITSTRF